MTISFLTCSKLLSDLKQPSEKKNCNYWESDSNFDADSILVSDFNSGSD